MKWITQYSGWLRQVRLFHWLNNVFNRRKLLHNRPVYKKLGIHRSVLRSIDSRVINHFIDIHDAGLLEKHVGVPKESWDLPEDVDWEEALEKWEKLGYIQLAEYFPAEIIAKINQAVKIGLSEGRLHYNYTGRKIFNAQKQATELNAVIDDPGILNMLGYLFDRQPIHFQTINFLHGSEQSAHSDSIHMTTVPLGYLAGVWVALEEIHPDNGPLTYYPGSHKLPYILNSDYGNTSNSFLLDGRANEKYERKVREIVKENGLEERKLDARPGDVFIWHANLLHGGAPINRPDSTRKSMVSHYFAEDVLCYHEISERPAMIKGK